MTAGELIAILSSHHPDTPVLVSIGDPEFGGPNLVADVCDIDRVVAPDGTYLEVLA